MRTFFFTYGRADQTYTFLVTGDKPPSIEKLGDFIQVIKNFDGKYIIHTELNNKFDVGHLLGEFMDHVDFYKFEDDVLNYVGKADKFYTSNHG